MQTNNKKRPLTHDLSSKDVVCLHQELHSFISPADDLHEWFCIWGSLPVLHICLELTKDPSSVNYSEFRHIEMKVSAELDIDTAHCSPFWLFFITVFLMEECFYSSLCTQSLTTYLRCFTWLLHGVVQGVTWRLTRFVFPNFFCIFYLLDSKPGKPGISGPRLTPAEFHQDLFWDSK